MLNSTFGRIALLSIAVLIVATMSDVAWDPTSSRGVSAQSEPALTGSIVQLPPAVPGPAAPPVSAATTIGTPMAPPASSDADVAAPANGESVTASLGGSDISVSSVGGSYEVDRPGRRGNRSPRR